MVACRIVAFSFGASCGAHALSPITVQYESLPTAGRMVADVDFDARAARLTAQMERVDAQFSTFESARPVSFVAGVALQAEGVPQAGAECVRDYNAPCPSGWEDRGDGGSCTAPVSYDGPCGGALDFKGLASHEKMTLAHSCGVSFACVGACSADYSQLCPGGWSVDAAGVCVAPAGYPGPCVGRKSFAQFAWADKAVFEDACAVRWPCRGPLSELQRPGAAESCVADYAKPCPRGWVSRGEACVAPASYTGPCSILWAFGGYTDDEKHVVSERCGALWPCRA